MTRRNAFHSIVISATAALLVTAHTTVAQVNPLSSPWANSDWPSYETAVPAISPYLYLLGEETSGISNYHHLYVRPRLEEQDQLRTHDRDIEHLQRELNQLYMPPRREAWNRGHLNNWQPSIWQSPYSGQPLQRPAARFMDLSPYYGGTTAPLHGPVYSFDD